MGSCCPWGAPFAVTPWGRHARLNKGEAPRADTVEGRHPLPVTGVTLKEGEAPQTTASVHWELFGIFCLEWFFVFLLDQGGRQPPQEPVCTYVMCMYQVMYVV